MFLFPSSFFFIPGLLYYCSSVFYSMNHFFDCSVFFSFFVFLPRLLQGACAAVPAPLISSSPVQPHPGLFCFNPRTRCPHRKRPVLSLFIGTNIIEYGCDMARNVWYFFLFFQKHKKHDMCNTCICAYMCACTHACVCTYACVRVCVYE